MQQVLASHDRKGSRHDRYHHTRETAKEDAPEQTAAPLVWEPLSRTPAIFGTVEKGFSEEGRKAGRQAVGYGAR